MVSRSIVASVRDIVTLLRLSIEPNLQAELATFQSTLFNLDKLAEFDNSGIVEEVSHYYEVWRWSKVLEEVTLFQVQVRRWFHGSGGAF